MSKHTPGNWLVLDLREHEERIERLTVSNGEHVVCRIENTVRGGPIDEQDVANARLIAAAPELLDELKSLYRAYVRLLEAGHDRILSLGGDCDPVDKMESEDQNLRSAKAAISKATA